MIKHFPPSARRKSTDLTHQRSKHRALVPAPAAEVHTRFQLCGMMSGAYRDRQTREMGDAHPVLLHLLRLAAQTFLPPILPAPHPFGRQMRMGREVVLGPALPALLRWCFCLLSAMMGGLPHTSRKSCFCKGCFY